MCIYFLIDFILWMFLRPKKLVLFSEDFQEDKEIGFHSRDMPAGLLLTKT